MKSIIVIINELSGGDSLLRSAANLALFFDSDMRFIYVIKAPENWDKLGRSSRDKYPDEKKEINLAKQKMDAWLNDSRSMDIESSKDLLFYEGKEISQHLEYNESSVVLTCRKTLMDKATRDFITKNSMNTLVIDKELKIEALSYGIFHADFKTKSEATSYFLGRLLELPEFSLNLIFINTEATHESSAISIRNMKQLINNYALSKTKISIFYADTINEGLEEIIDLYGADIVIRELNNGLEPLDLETTALPTLLICNR
ncbi:MAG: hypothetical protein R3279_06720 [Putridiphycobacter sp.]|nr:hypothetical protein [Putridiphycobacter sp.]